MSKELISDEKKLEGARVLGRGNGQYYKDRGIIGDHALRARYKKRYEKLKANVEKYSQYVANCTEYQRRKRAEKIPLNQKQDPYRDFYKLLPYHIVNRG